MDTEKPSDAIPKELKLTHNGYFQETFQVQRIAKSILKKVLPKKAVASLKMEDLTVDDRTISDDMFKEKSADVLMLLIFLNLRFACKQLLMLMVFFSFLLLSGITGCFNSNSQTILDDSTLDLLSRGAIVWGNLQCSENSNDHYDLTLEQSRSLILAMKPIRHIGAEEILSDRMDYSFSFQQGRNPAHFRISIKDDELIIIFDGQIYLGGNKSLFMKIIGTVDDSP